MDAQKVDIFLTTNRKLFPASKLPLIREKLLAADEGKYIVVQSLDHKDPTVVLIISLFLGSLGIDRFMLGDVGIGILKLLTGGVCGILTIIDWFTVMNKAREKNYQELMLLL